MPADETNDKSERFRLQIDKNLLQTSDTQSARNAPASDIKAAHALNKNAASGSAGGDQEHSIQIVCFEKNEVIAERKKSELAQLTSAPQLAMHDSVPQPTPQLDAANQPVLESLFSTDHNHQKLAIRDDYLNRYECALPAEDIPPGATPGHDYFSLSEFLSRPVVQRACKISEAFAKTVDEIQKVPWAKELHIWKRDQGKYLDYDPETSRLEIDAHASPKRQMETFAHEGYHASHQDLSALYLHDKPLTYEHYLSIKMRQEAGAFLREIETNEEIRKASLDQNKQPIEFVWCKPGARHPQTKAMNELLVRDPSGKIQEELSLVKIQEFLCSHPAVRYRPGTHDYARNADGTLIPEDYAPHYAAGYPRYHDLNFYLEQRKALKDKGYI